MDWEVIALDHMLLVELLEVRVTLSPWQKVVEPPTVMVGVAGSALTVIYADCTRVSEPPVLVTISVTS
jgi:hypothetical protein